MRPARHLALLALLGLAAAANAGPSRETNPVVSRSAFADAASGRIIVKLRSTTTADGRAEAQVGDPVAGLAGRTGVAVARTRTLAPQLLVVEPGDGAGLALAIERLRTDPAVEFAEVDLRRHAHALPSDPLYTGQWFLQNAQPSAIDAVTAWDTTTGSNGVVVAVLDTGIRFDHPDLKRATEGGRLLPGYDFVSGETATAFRIPNDGDGWDADPSDPGDWVTSDEKRDDLFSDCDVGNSSWHGTRVAGMIAAITNNALGVAGTGWQGWLLPVRVLGKCGGYDSDIIAAMRWSAGLPVAGVPANPYPARIVNLSLGGGSGACPASYQSAVDELAARGVLVVVSAGNEGGPVDVPANCRGAVAVLGLRHVGTKVGFSNLGPQVTLGAPGGNCVNVGAGQPCLFSLDTTSNSGTQGPGASLYTDQLNANVGTSFSAPLVSGVAGLMLAVNGNLGVPQLTTRLRQSAKPYPVSSDPAIPACRVPTSASDLQTSECSCNGAACGAGMLNARGAVAEALRPIAAIAVQGGVSAGQNVTLSAAGSAASCGRTVASYAWTVVDPGPAPPGISGGTTASATVVAPSSGAFTLRVTVTDSAGRQDSADVVVGSSSATTGAPSSAGAAACPTVLSFTAPAPPAATPAGSSGGGGGGPVGPWMLLALAPLAGRRALAAWRASRAAA